MELEGPARVLFAPQFQEGLGQPGGNGQQPVDAGVAGAAQGDKPAAVVEAGSPVVNKVGGGAAGPAAAAVAGHDGGAVPPETALGVPALGGAAPAKAGGRRKWLAANAEEGELVVRAGMGTGEQSSL